MFWFLMALVIVILLGACAASLGIIVKFAWVFCTTGSTNISAQDVGILCLAILVLIIAGALMAAIAETFDKRAKKRREYNDLRELKQQVVELNHWRRESRQQL